MGVVASLKIRANNVLIVESSDMCQIAAKFYMENFKSTYTELQGKGNTGR